MEKIVQLVRVDWAQYGEVVIYRDSSGYSVWRGKEHRMFTNGQEAANLAREWCGGEPLSEVRFATKADGDLLEITLKYADDKLGWCSNTWNSKKGGVQCTGAASAWDALFTGICTYLKVSESPENRVAVNWLRDAVREDVMLGV